MGRPCRDCEAAEIRLASECQAREEEANSKGLEYKCTCPPSPTGSCTHGSELLRALTNALLDVEWAGRSQWGQPVCPSCHGDEYEENEPRTGHEKDCALLKALQLAGVR